MAKKSKKSKKAKKNYLTFKTEEEFGEYRQRIWEAGHEAGWEAGSQSVRNRIVDALDLRTLIEEVSREQAAKYQEWLDAHS